MRTPLAEQATSRKRTARVFLFAATLLVLALALSLSSVAQAAPSFIYVNNQGIPNTISGYSVDMTTGALNQLPNSPYTSGSNGADGSTCRSLTRMVQSGSFVYVSNAGDQTITSFTIQADHSLQSFPPPVPVVLPATPVQLPPTLFPSGLTLDNCQGISLAASPDGKFLMASSGGVINTFAINALDGSLSVPALPAVSSTVNCCSPSAGMKTFSNGGAQYLALSNLSSVSVYLINADGSLTAATGSPFPQTGTGSLAGLQATCAGDRLFGSEAAPTNGAITDAWTVGAGGVLSPVPGSPFIFSGTGANAAVLTPDNEFIFESNITSPAIRSANVPASGVLTDNGSLSVSGFNHAPEGMDIDQTGQFLFSANDGFGIAVQRILAGGVLTNISNTPINRAGQIQEVIANPSRTCLTADLNVTMTATPNPVINGAPIAYTVSVTNTGTSASSAVISNSLPAALAAGGTTTIAAAPLGLTRSGGVATVTTVLPHALIAGEPVSIAQVTADPSFQGTFPVAAVLSPTSFTYAQTLLPNTPVGIGGGTATSPACWIPAIPATNNGVCGGVNDPAVVIPIASATGVPVGVSRANGVGGTGVVTVTTTTPHHLFAGEAVTISVPDPTVQVVVGIQNPIAPPGTLMNSTITVTDPTFNGSYTVASTPNSTTFTYNQTGLQFPELALTAPPIAVAAPPISAPAVPATDISGGGTATSAQLLPQTITFASLAPGAPAQTAMLNVTSSPSLAVGDIVNNTVTISNKSAMDSNLADNSFALPVTVTTSVVATALTVSPATAPYGGVVNLAAHLVRTDNGTSLAGKPVVLSLNGVGVGSALTDNSGTANLTVSIGATAVGTYPGAISATFAGDLNFSAGVTALPATLTVTPGTLTVVPTQVSRPYGSPNPAIFGYAISGFQNGDTAAVVSGTATCTIPVTITVTSPVGNSAITCDITGMSAANYTITTIPGAFLITPAPLNITADNQTRAFGAADPVFTGTITGIQNGDAVTATYASNDTASSPVGTYPIVPTVVGLPAVLSNYSVTLVNGTLTVTPVVVAGAPLTVTMNNATRLYGSPNPTFSATITGALNGDTFTVTGSTTATVTSPVSNPPAVTYSINVVSVTGANIANYVVTPVAGTLTINPAPLTVFANPASGVYGSAPAGLTGTINGLKNGDVITTTFNTTATATSPVVPVAPATSYPITSGVLVPVAPALVANYAVNRVNGVYTITPFALTVTAPTFTRVYGAPNPAIVLGGPTVADGITAFVAAPGVTSPVGTYTSMAALSDPSNRLANNYTVTLLNGIATVTRATLTITPASQSMSLGAPAPSLTAGAIYAGFVGADTPASLTGTLKCTASSSNGGLHLITCSGQSSNNYTITFATGILTVNYVAACTAGPGLVILPPLGPAISPSFVKATTTSIPITFRACDITGKSISAPVITPTLTPPGIGSATIIGPGGPITPTFSVNNGLWISTFTTAGKALGLYTGTVTLNDGTVMPFSFSLI